MTGYTDIIRRYAADDRRIGTLQNADGTGEVGLDAGERGSRLAVRFALRSDGERVEQIRFQVFGCGFTIAACAAAAELAEGKPLTTVRAIRPEWVDAVLGGLPAERDYCATLAVQALQAAVTGVHGNQTVQSKVQPAEEAEHTPRLSAANPLYRALIDSPVPGGVSMEDRHLFACLLTVAAQETGDMANTLGLAKAEVNAILTDFFPAFNPTQLKRSAVAPATPPSESNREILRLLLSHVPTDSGGAPLQTSRWLAHILAARAARPGHLWIAMGFFERPELTAVIRRHLPSLAAANHQGMRWKRFLFKQICEQNGGLLCKAPDCGLCSDYPLCFGSN